MNFRTELTLQAAPLKINLEDSILLIGSCFAQELYSHLKLAGFGNLQMPLGTIYNPSSIEKLLSFPWDFMEIESRVVAKNNGLFYHLDAPSNCFGSSLPALKNALREKELSFQQVLKGVTTVVITLGTALVFELEGETVCNNHKTQLHKRFLTLQALEANLEGIYKHLLKECPQLKQIIWSISPVRHTRQGIENNARSKALLKVALSNFLDDFSKKEPLLSYFPAYELLLDDLRDYRFYAEDLVHPSNLAIDYIMEKFELSFMDASLIPLFSAAKRYHQALQHIPTNASPESEEFVKWKAYLHHTYLHLSSLGLALDKPSIVNE